MTIWLTAMAVVCIVGVTLIADVNKADRQNDKGSPSDHSQMDQKQTQQRGFQSASQSVSAGMLCRASDMIGSDVKSMAAKHSMGTSGAMNHKDYSDASTQAAENSQTRTYNQDESSEWEAGDLDSTNVDYDHSESIGSVAELIINDDQDQIKYVVLEADGQRYPAPWHAFKVKSKGQHQEAYQTQTTQPVRSESDRPMLTGEKTDRQWDMDREQPQLYLKLSKAQLQQAPTIDASVSIEKLNDAQFQQKVDQFYSRYVGSQSQPGFSQQRSYPQQPGQMNRPYSGTETQTDRQLTDQQSPQQRSYQQQRQSGQMQQDRPYAETGTQTDRQFTDPQSQQPGYSAGFHGNLLKASNIIGLDLQSDTDTDLGNVEDLVVDARDGRVAYGLISFGGFMNIGEKVAAVPWSSLNIQPQQRFARINATSDQLNKCVLEDKSIAQLSEQQFANRIHDNFGTEPYWTVYGFIPAQGAGVSNRSWQSGSSFNQKFDADTITTVQGKITNVGSFSPETGASAGTELKVKTDKNETVTVYLGPKDYISEKGISLDSDSDIKVTGSKVTMNGKSVILATEVTVDDQTLQLRDRQGNPEWSDWSGLQQQQSDLLQQTEPNQSSQQESRSQSRQSQNRY